MAASSAEVSREAYRTLLLHCAKHPATAITGLLLAPKGSTSVVRALPLQHHWNQLSPMVEVGYSLAQAHAQSQSNPLEIVGLYYAPADVPSSQRQQLHPVALKVAQMIAERIGREALALQINNSKLGSKTDHPLLAFSVAHNASANVSALPASALSITGGTEAVTAVRSDVVSGQWKAIVDFDDHLEDTSLNWLTASG